MAGVRKIMGNAYSENKDADVVRVNLGCSVLTKEVF
jgi:hypothetical protein